MTTLCCPQAIVLARGAPQNREDPNLHRQWTRPNANKRRITQAAQDLLEEGHLPQQPCSPERLHQLATAPSLQDYTIVVIDAKSAFACLGHGDTLLGLLHEDGHYDALSSLPGFFRKSYFCSRCFQAYNDQGQHACPNNEANHCGACLQEGCQGCQAHQSKTQASKPVDPQHPSVCVTCRKCKECHRVLRSVKEIRTHGCGFQECRCCHEQVDIHQHRCFLQDQKTPGKVRREQGR